MSESPEGTESTGGEDTEPKPQGLEPKKSPYIFGIDLGTSNSCIAIYRSKNAEVLPVEGTDTCPSVVTVLKDGKVVVGRQARARMMIDPQNTVASIKRKMGTEEAHQFEGLPDKEYKPEEISAWILGKLIDAARESDVDLRGYPRFAVVCIPANFTEEQKQATKDAASMANLDALFLLEEPAAAALAYACERDRDQTILVYDLGGGTFDVAILKVVSSSSDKSVRAKFEFLSKEGVQELGGDDFDKKIVALAAAKLLEESKVDIQDDKRDQGISKRAIREAQQKMKEAAVEAKHELTEAQESDIVIPNLVKDEEGQVHNLEFTITREQFNDSIRDLIMQSKTAVEKALEAGKVEMDDISRIILVGGSTRVPLVKEMLTEMFGKEPYSDENPDTVVARGAAIFGAKEGVPDDELDDTEKANEEDEFDGDVEIQNIVTHHLGIEVSGGRFNRIIEKGLEIPQDEPVTGMKQFATPRDDMTDIRIAVYQAVEESEYVADEGVKWIGEFYLSGIPPRPKGQERIDVTFEIDTQNMLHVKAKSSSSEGDLSIDRS